MIKSSVKPHRAFFILFLSPTAYFLPTAAKSMQKMPPETDGFWTSFCVQELLPKFRRSRESAFFYSRCRYIGWLKGVVLLPGESILPSGRTISFFIWAGAAAGLLLSQFPRHLISNETLEGKGNPKTIDFWRKPPKRRLWRMKRGGFEEVSRFSRHNVAGKRLARRCRLSAAIRGKLYPPEVINHFWQSICLRSSPHKYSPIRQFFTISSYFSGFVKFS